LLIIKAKHPKQRTKQHQDQHTRKETPCKYGFYTTEYGIGIFCYFSTDGVINSIEKMKKYLLSKNIPFKNEFSDARWVFRFVLNLDKPKHELLLNSFN